MQDLPHGSRRNGDARGFVSSPWIRRVHIKRILLRQANDEACGARECWRAALGRLLVLYFLGASLPQ